MKTGDTDKLLSLEEQVHQQLSASLKSRYDESLCEVAQAMWESFVYHGKPAFSDVSLLVASVEFLLVATHEIPMTLDTICELHEVSPKAVIPWFESMMEALEIPEEALEGYYEWLEEKEEEWEEEWEEEEVDLGLSPEDFLQALQQAMNPNEVLPPMEWTGPEELPEDLLQELLQLPRTPEVWLGGVHLLEQIVPDPFPHRLQLMLWMVEESEMILSYRLLEDSGNSADVAVSLLNAFFQPEAGMPRLPARVHVIHEELVEGLQRFLAPLDIQVELGNVEQLSSIVEAMNEQLSFEQELDYPGYLEDGRFSPELLRAFFEASAEFVDSVDWSSLGEEQVRRVDLREWGLGERILVFSGTSLQDFQLLLYSSEDEWKAIRQMLRACQELGLPPMIPSVHFLRLVFESERSLPEAFVKEVDTYQWNIHDPQGYPYLSHVNALRGERWLQEDDYWMMIACLQLLSTSPDDFCGVVEVSGSPYQGVMVAGVMEEEL